MPEGPELLYFATVLKKKLDDGKIIEIISNTNKPVMPRVLCRLHY